MKTKLSLLIACVLVMQAASAQFHLGIKAGSNITKIDGKSFKDEFRYGYLLGGFAEIGLGGKLSVQPEVLYNQYQSMVDSSFKAIYQNAFNPSYNSNIKLNYLSIPLMLNYKLGSLLALQAGPQFGILLDHNKTLFQNGKDAFDKGDFSLAGGLQIKISKLRLGGRYVIGLNNINDFDEKDKWKSQAVQLSVGLAL